MRRGAKKNSYDTNMLNAMIANPGEYIAVRPTSGKLICHGTNLDDVLANIPNLGKGRRVKAVLSYSSATDAIVSFS